MKNNISEKSFHCWEVSDKAQSALPDFSFDSPGPTIGFGSYGEVYKVQALIEESPTYIAMKKIQDHVVQPSDEMTLSMKEVDILKLIGSHANIVEFYGYTNVGSPKVLSLYMWEHASLWETG